RCPWRTSRRRPSSVNLSVWVLSQAATSASRACPNSVLAPLRKTSVSGSENVPGWVSSKTLVSVTAYHSFGGKVEALNTPAIRPLTPSCRHQLSALAHAQARRISEPQIAPTLNIDLPGPFFISFYPSNDIRINYGAPVAGQTGRLFLPFDALIGVRLSDQVALSLEGSVPIVKAYPVYNFKAEVKLRVLF